MSLKAMIWVMEDAPVENHAELAILYALADRANTAPRPWVRALAISSRIEAMDVVDMA